MKIYAYVMTWDTGFAPAVQDGLLSLACCETLLRYRAERYIKDTGDKEVYVVGLRGKELGERNNLPVGQELLPVYIAKVSNTVDCSEYYSNPSYSSRPDCKYKYENGIWYILKNNPHHDRDNENADKIRPHEKWEADGDLRYIFKKTNKENKVLLSEYYIYYGNSITEYPNEVFKKIAYLRNKSRRRGYNIDLTEDEKWEFQDFFDKNCINVRSNVDDLIIDKSFEGKTKQIN